MKHTMRALFALLLCLLVVLMALPTALAVEPDPDPATPDSETADPEGPSLLFLMATGSNIHTLGSMSDLIFTCSDTINSFEINGT